MPYLVVLWILPARYFQLLRNQVSWSSRTILRLPLVLHQWKADRHRLPMQLQSWMHSVSAQIQALILMLYEWLSCGLTGFCSRNAQISKREKSGQLKNTSFKHGNRKPTLIPSSNHELLAGTCFAYYRLGRPRHICIVRSAHGPVRLTVVFVDEEEACV